MRSIVPSDEKPAASARRAHSTIPSRATPRTALGSPIPISTALSSQCRTGTRGGAGALLGAVELPDRDPKHDNAEQRDHARLEEAGDPPAEPRHARVERVPR